MLRTSSGSQEALGDDPAAMGRVALPSGRHQQATDELLPTIDPPLKPGKFVRATTATIEPPAPSAVTIVQHDLDDSEGSCVENDDGEI